MVRCKFKFIRFDAQVVDTRQADGSYKPEQVYNLYLVPVGSSGGSEENKKFFAATPSGELKLGLVKQHIADQLVLNREYYIDISEADNLQ